MKPTVLEGSEFSLLVSSGEHLSLALSLSYKGYDPWPFQYLLDAGWARAIRRPQVSACLWNPSRVYHDVVSPLVSTCACAIKQPHFCFVGQQQSFFLQAVHADFHIQPRNIGYIIRAWLGSCSWWGYGRDWARSLSIVLCMLFQSRCVEYFGVDVQLIRHPCPASNHFLHSWSPTRQLKVLLWGCSCNLLGRFEMVLVWGLGGASIVPYGYASWQECHVLLLVSEDADSSYLWIM